MKKTYFAFSDVHGFYDEMITALKEAGFDYDNPSHIAICVGDWCDRGPQALQTFEWLKDMQNKERCIVLQGNHDEFFLEFLRGPVTNFNYRYNGLNETLDDFLHSTSDFQMYVVMHASEETSTGLQEGCSINQLWNDWCTKSRKQILTEYPDLLAWLENLQPYFETKNYIFTHGSIQPYLDWKTPEKGWNWHHWDKGSFINEQIMNTDKTIVLGHFDSGSLRKMHHLGKEDDFSILKSPDGQKIFIDGCTVISGIVNVLVLEDEECE